MDPTCAVEELNFVDYKLLELSGSENNTITIVEIVIITIMNTITMWI